MKITNDLFSPSVTLSLKNLLFEVMNIWHTKSYVMSGQLNILQIIRQFVNDTENIIKSSNLFYYNGLGVFLLFGTQVDIIIPAIRKSINNK